MEPCLRVQLKTVWCKITLLVRADAEIIGLWEPILPGMCRKYFGELPQKNLFLHEYTEICDVIRKISQLPRVQSTLGHSMHAITVCGSPYVTHCDSTF